MSAVTTHILDTMTGEPAAGIPVVLERKTHTSGWQVIAQGTSDADGRVTDLLGAHDAFLPGHYRLTFEVGPYFQLGNTECFFPQVSINFAVRDALLHYHVPLLISPYGYTTYRGS